MATQFGSYEPLKRLGAGGTAEVFLAVGPTPSSDELLALKVLLEHLATREESVSSFLKEARTSSLLRHPNLVEVFEVGEASNGRPFIAMELVRGWSVSALNKKLKAAGERMDLDAACELVRQAALGLHFAHQATGRDGTMLGLVHRDVSPQNVMVTESGVAKVVDFGLAKATLQQETNTRALKGKLRYMPPEQLRSQSLDRRADVFALGAVLWELVCGQPLAPGTSEAEVFQQALFLPQPHPDEIQKRLPRALVEVLQRTVERTLDKRMPTCAALAEALAPMSSPDAREKLSRHVRAHFEPYPRTASEARGESARAPAAGIPNTSISSSAPRKPRVGVLAPPPPRPAAPPSAPVPWASDDRDRKTEAMTLPAESVDETNPGNSTVSGSQRHNGSTAPTLMSLHDDTGLSALSSPTLSAVTSDATLLGESGSVTNPDGFVLPMHTIADEDVPESLRARRPKGPSKVVIGIAVVAAVAMVALGVVLGRLIRGNDPQVVATDPTASAALDDELKRRLIDAGMERPVGAGSVESARSAAGVAKKKELARGMLELSASEPALVREKNNELGITPLTLSLTVGRHRLSVATPDGSRSTEIDVQISANTTIKKTVKLNGAR